MVEHVVDLEPQLQAHVFFKGKVLEQGHIPVVDSRSRERVATDIAHTTNGRFGERIGIEPVQVATNSLVIVGEIVLTRFHDQLEPGFLRYSGRMG